MTFSAVYDLVHGPVSYDFVTWLVRAKKEAGDRRLHVVIAPKEDGLGGFSRNWGKHDEHAARWRLWHICVAAAPLAEATVTVAPSRKWAEGADWWPEGKAHFMGPLVDAARKGEAIPKLRATEAARRYVRRWAENLKRPYVTLTLRDQDTDPARNSDLTAWDQLALTLDGRFAYIRLEDTQQALQRSYGNFPETDIDLRLALYEQAAMNLIGNNGPQELLKFSDAPYLIFNLGIESWREHFRKYFHMEFGDQLPWANKNQRLIYKPDSFAVMLEAFENWALATS